MKTTNLVVAIVYSLIYAGLFLSGLMDNDSELVVGCVFMAGPVVVNWITYSHLKKSEK